MVHFKIPGKFIRTIKNTYDAMTGKVVHAGKLSDSFAVKPGAKTRRLFNVTILVPAGDRLHNEGDNR